MIKKPRAIANCQLIHELLHNTLHILCVSRPTAYTLVSPIS